MCCRFEVDSMAGKRGRSGPPGNLNAVREPWRIFWRRRALGASDRWLLPLLEDYADGLKQHRGGENNLTAVEQHLIEIAQTARGCALLILRDAAQYGRTRIVSEAGSQSWGLAPGYGELPRFLNLERQALTTLGLEKRLPPPVNLKDYLANRSVGSQEPERRVEPQESSPVSPVGSPSPHDSEASR
jgi:hypothetical protein